VAEKTRGAGSVTWLDFDRDGDLDLVVSRNPSEGTGGISVWENRGAFRLIERTGLSDVAKETTGAQTLPAVDWDHDGELDVPFVGAHGGEPGLLWGRGEGRFRLPPPGSRSWPPPSEQPPGAQAAVVLDVDSDGCWDLLTAGPRGLRFVRTRRGETHDIEASPPESISDFPAERIAVLDYDNDGRPDIAAFSRDAARGFHQEQKRFQATDDVLPLSIKVVADPDCGDFDCDGDVDLLVVVATPRGRELRLLRNDGGNGNHWIDVWLADGGETAAAEDTRRGSPVGTWVQLKAASFCQSQMAHGRRVHFGIGQLDEADVLRVAPSAGAVTNVLSPAKNQTVDVHAAPRASRAK
jgi:hypothetical protein